MHSYWNARMPRRQYPQGNKFRFSNAKGGTIDTRETRKAYISGERDRCEVTFDTPLPGIALDNTSGKGFS